MIYHLPEFAFREVLEISLLSYHGNGQKISSFPDDMIFSSVADP
jgi:hypothetical protein